MDRKRSPHRRRRRSRSPFRFRENEERKELKPMTVQSISFPRTWKRSYIDFWLSNHNYHPLKEERTPNFTRFRIREPILNGIFATKVLPNGVHLILMK
ncbi:hypothetical protein IIV31_021R [Armadillidium vulgare iridescent virus]|uniref:Uncharacterized protein n=1 Tax=Armadillidium vulgare iridescent virus TaxID=72201 RepID=A0A068QKN6_9VIRU|nr:hypothetical protein IIV31_021R [Armadillidium vulgare iridescent virus]CCV02393.1 hypothetical protein IIV31_021R [Armadillidium vulgare iridescent virus]